MSRRNAKVLAIGSANHLGNYLALVAGIDEGVHERQTACAG